MKNKMFLLVGISLLALASAVGEEVKIGSFPEDNVANRYQYYSGIRGTASYELDWETFYDKMHDVASSKQYKYIYLEINNFSPPNRFVDEDSLTVDITTSEYIYRGRKIGETAIFHYMTPHKLITMRFCNNLSFYHYMEVLFEDKNNNRKFLFDDFEHAAKAWDHYIK